MSTEQTVAKETTPPPKKLTKLQVGAIGGLAAAAVAIGAGGVIGTIHNMTAVFGSGETALGIVAAAEGAVLVAALTTVVMYTLHQAVPAAIRTALVGIPLTAALVGGIVAPGLDEAVAFAFTQLAMAVGAECLALAARTAITYSSGISPDARKRNADIVRDLNWHTQMAGVTNGKLKRWHLARARHLARKVGQGDNALAERLNVIQQDHIAQGASNALGTLFTPPGDAPALPAADDRKALPAPVQDASGTPEPGPFRTTPESSTEPQDVDHDDVPDEPAKPALPVRKSGGRKPAHTDEELIDAGRGIYRKMGPPRTPYAFRKAMKDAGYGGGTDRLNAVFEQIQTEFRTIAVEDVTADVTEEEIEQD